MSKVSVKVYGLLALILCGMTFLEWLVFSIPSLRSLPWVFVGILSALSLTKLIIVAGWYMHLKQDAKIFSKLFVVSVVLTIFFATVLYFSLLYGVE